MNVVAAAKHHTVIATDAGELFTWGSNRGMFDSSQIYSKKHEFRHTCHVLFFRLCCFHALLMAIFNKML